MSIESDVIRGHTDAIIMAHLLKNDNYGYEINKSIAEITGGEYELKEATLYTAFKRLEQLGYITSYWGNENIGARRKYYSITKTGIAAYRKMYSDWKHAEKLIDALLVGLDTKKY